MQSTSEKWKVWVERGCQTLVLQCNRIKPATKLSRKRMSVSCGVFGQQLAGPEPAGRTLASLVESHTGKGCCGEQWHPLFMIFVCFQRGHGTRMQKGRLLNICVRSLLPSRSLLQKIYSSTVYHLSSIYLWKKSSHITACEFKLTADLCLYICQIVWTLHWTCYSCGVLKGKVALAWRANMSERVEPKGSAS